jgi:hypothetical protein
MRFLSFIALILSFHTAYATGPLLISKDLPGWEISNPDFYSAKQLYGYINGGAEIYLEYGFRQVTAQRATKGKLELQVDVYEMVSAESAFGMYSILRGDCADRLTGSDWSCVKPEQILLARDKFLVSVVPYDRSTESRAAAKKAAAALLKRIGKKDFRVPELFNSGPFSAGRMSLRYLHGPLALQSGLADWESALEGIQRFDLYYTSFGKGKSATEAMIVTFKSRRDCESFLKHMDMAEALKNKGWFVREKAQCSVLSKPRNTLYYLKGGQAEKLRARIH